MLATFQPHSSLAAQPSDGLLGYGRVTETDMKSKTNWDIIVIEVGGVRVLSSPVSFLYLTSGIRCYEMLSKELLKFSKSTNIKLQFSLCVCVCWGGGSEGLPGKCGKEPRNR